MSRDRETALEHHATAILRAADIEISRIGLELKSVIDQLREQVQNIE